MRGHHYASLCAPSLCTVPLPYLLCPLCRPMPPTVPPPQNCPTPLCLTCTLCSPTPCTPLYPPGSLQDLQVPLHHFAPPCVSLSPCPVTLCPCAGEGLHKCDVRGCPATCRGALRSPPHHAFAGMPRLIPWHQLPSALCRVIALVPCSCAQDSSPPHTSWMCASE